MKFVLQTTADPSPCHFWERRSTEALCGAHESSPERKTPDYESVTCKSCLELLAAQKSAAAQKLGVPADKLRERNEKERRMNGSGYWVDQDHYNATVSKLEQKITVLKSSLAIMEMW